jgi:hypothetical protein
VASYTFDSLPANERAVLPVAEKIAAALDWTLSDDAGSTAP